jgi:uncharacterized protein with PhoU and TrkA domain
LTSRDGRFAFARYSASMGVRDQRRKFNMRFNPSSDEVIHLGDRLIAIGEPIGPQCLEQSAKESA